jgi:type IV secretory pathway ATPase VirB11/archaellum biosynthesis ATPase
MLIHSLFKQESSSMQGIPFLKERFIQSLKKGELLSWQELTRPLEMYEYNKEDMALIKLKMWYEKLTQIDFLKLFQNQSFEEIIIHNEQNAYYIKNGVEYPLDLNYTNEELQILYEVLTLKMGVNWNLKDPFVSFFYQEQNIQLRISLMHFSTSPTKQSKIFIRNIQTQIFRLENFTQNTELITFLTNAI